MWAVLTLQQFDDQLTKLIRELARRIVVPRMGEFEAVWEIANGVCDRYAFHNLDTSLRKAA
jgi:hypothetical protein